jgi:hypothetical protein
MNMALEGNYGTDAKNEETTAPLDMFGDPFHVLKPCCEEAVGTATENLAILAKGLFEKAEGALDLAVVQATSGDANGAFALARAAEMYLVLAEATA